MKALILDGSEAYDGTAERVRVALMAEIQARGWEVEHVLLREKRIGHCTGDFGCHVRTPGICHRDDDNRAIAAAMVDSDLQVCLTPITFGGYSHALKRMVDHLIQNVTMFFRTFEGETHHSKRYRTAFDFLAVGWTPEPDPRSERVFRHLVERNATTFCARTHVCGVVSPSQSDASLRASALEWLDQLERGQSSPPAVSPPTNLPADPLAIRRALLLVGSPKKRQSASHALGDYLFERLRENGVQTENILLYDARSATARMEALLDAVRAADLIMLAFPLYIDALPAPVIEVLKHIAAERQAREARRQWFAAVGNCGFPESRQLTAALAICESFARQARFEWAGSLALGGGPLLIGRPLGQGGKRTLRVRQALTCAAEALARGRPIPKAAQDFIEKPLVPPWIYRWLGTRAMKKMAKGHGVKHLLNRRPYDKECS